MADNTNLSAAVGSGDTLRTDDNAGVKTPVSKIELGIDGAFDGFVAATNPMPIAANTIKDGSGTVLVPLVDADGHLQIDVLSSALPSGAATAAKQPALGTAGTASADVITVQGAASMTPIVVDGSAVTQPVSAASLPLPSGAATAANQATANAALAAVQAAVETLDNAIAGTEMQVDIVASLPAGTNAIGKLSANDGIDIGDVDVASLPATVHSADFDTGAGTDTTLAFGIAVPASGGAAVIPGDATAGLKVDLGADNDVTLATLPDTAGSDLAAINTAAAAIQAAVEGTLTVGSHAVTNAGTFAVQAAQSGGWTVDLGATDNAVLDAIAASLAGTLTVGSHAVTNAGTFAVQAAQSGTWAVELGATDNAVLDAIAASLAGTLTVGSHAVTNAGTFAVQVDGAALTALQVMDDWDETDRCKVNPIVGQAGIAGGSGATGATTTRVTVATDDQLLTDTATMISSLGAIDTASGSIDAAVATGATPGKLISAASTNATSVKASAGRLMSVQAFNTNAAARYLKFYNKASAPTVGTDTPVQVYLIPGNTAGAGVAVPIPVCGIAFSTGIAFATTTGAADSDTGAVAANEIVLSYSYK